MIVFFLEDVHFLIFEGPVLPQTTQEYSGEDELNFYIITAWPGSTCEELTLAVCLNGLYDYYFQIRFPLYDC